MTFLIDTNVWLELLLRQEKAEEVEKFIQSTPASLFSISDFSLYSMGVLLTRLKKDAVYQDFLSDTIEDSAVARICLTTADLKSVLQVHQTQNLDFDDAYQYVAAEKYNLTLVSFDSDFDRTKRGRKTPAELLKK